MLLQKQSFALNISIAIVTASALFLVLVFFIFTFLLKLQRRRQQHTLEITEMTNKYAQELLRSQLEIQEQTLRTISQEIHDNIGQVLSLAKLQLYSLKDNCTQNDLQPTKELISKSINDLRDLSKSLNPDRIADIGLMESIKHELQLLQKTNAMETLFEVRGQMRKIPPEKKIIVFRIFQELMNNAIRHSQASLLSVVMDYQPDSLHLILTDNGKGFDGSAKKGIGLQSMQNRAGMIHAALHLDSAKGRGAKAELIVPVVNENSIED
jgi:two-component system NarL family sensor kinase